MLLLNLKEGLEKIKRDKQEKEGLGVVKAVDRCSIYAVFFAVSLLGRAMRRKEAEREKRKAEGTASAATAGREEEVNQGVVSAFSRMSQGLLGRAADVERQLLEAHQEAVVAGDWDDADDLGMSDQASEGSLFSFDRFSDEGERGPGPAGRAAPLEEDDAVGGDTPRSGGDSDAGAAGGQGAQSAVKGGASIFSEEGVGIDRMDFD